MYNCVLYINQVSVKTIDGNTVAMFLGLPMLGRAVCHRALPIPAFEFVLASIILAGSILCMLVCRLLSYVCSNVGV